MGDEQDERYRKLEKENLLLTRKLERSEKRLEDAERLMDQTMSLLKRVTDERLTEEERHRLAVFRKFVPSDFLVSLGKDRFEDITLGDSVERTMTVLFSDIRNFTGISEPLSPKETFTFLNDYLNHVEPAIIQNGGFIDKFIGDAIMALFYTADDAIQAGIDMRTALQKYNQETNIPLNIGVGIHTGLCTLGIIGGSDRMEGTVISDAVNLASRLESLTKKFKSALLMSGITLDASQKSSVYLTRDLGRIKVVGRSTPVELIEVLDAEPPEIRELKRLSKEPLEDGLKLFYARDFSAAREKFLKALEVFPDDVVSKIYLDQIVNHIIEAPPQNWEGVITMLEK